MATQNPESPLKTPAAQVLAAHEESREEKRASSVNYLRPEEPKIPVWILIVGVLVVAAAVIAYLHFSRP